DQPAALGDRDEVVPRHVAPAPERLGGHLLAGRQLHDPLVDQAQVAGGQGAPEVGAHPRALVGVAVHRRREPGHPPLAPPPPRAPNAVSSASPTWCPSRSLTALKSSRSTSTRWTSSGPASRRASAIRVCSTRRLPRPVRSSRVAWAASWSRASRSCSTSRELS